MKKDIAEVRGPRVRATVSDLRRFLHTGVAMLRDRQYIWGGYDEFTTVEFARYLRLTAKQTFDALEEFRQMGVLGFKGTNVEGFEVWKLTKTGMYATASSGHKRNKFTKALAERAIGRMGEVGKVGARHLVVNRLLCSGPWMRGHSYGPLLIGVEVDDWRSIGVEERLDLIGELISAWELKDASLDVVVMGFSEKNGVPERLAVHSVAYESSSKSTSTGEVQTLEKLKLDMHEANYAVELLQDAAAYGLVHKCLEDEATNMDWWWLHRASSEMFGGQELGRERRRAHFDARRMLSIEIFGAMSYPVTGLMPKRGGKEEGLDEVVSDERTLEYLKRMGQGGWYDEDRVRVGKLAAEVDDLVERGQLKRLVWKTEEGKRVERHAEKYYMSGDLTAVVLAAREQRLKELGSYREEVTRQRKQDPMAVSYYVLYDIASDDTPRPVGLIRQPGGHRACVDSAMDSYGRTLAHTTLRDCKSRWLRWNAGLAMTTMRRATESEIAAFDEACERSGCMLRFILLAPDRTYVGRKGAYADIPVKMGLRLERVGGEEELGFMFDERYDSVLRAVEEGREEIPRGIAGKLKRWWINARDVKQKAMCEALMGEGADARLMAKAIDPSGTWSVNRQAAGKFSARYKGQEFAVELSDLAARSPKRPKMKLRMGDWECERKLVRRDRPEDEQEGTLSCADFLHVLRGVDLVARVGLDRSYEAFVVQTGMERGASGDGSGAVSQRLKLARLMDETVRGWTVVRSDYGGFVPEFARAVQETEGQAQHED